MSDIKNNGYSGVYLLLDDGVTVYVGQSEDVYKRIAQHKNEGVKQFNSFSFIPASSDDLDDLERMYILRLNPKYNILINGLVSIENLLVRVKSFTDRDISMSMLKGAIKQLNIPEILFKGRRLYKRSNDGVLAFASVVIADGGKFNEDFMAICREE